LFKGWLLHEAFMTGDGDLAAHARAEHDRAAVPR
jgi:hypothetical protein